MLILDHATKRKETELAAARFRGHRVNDLRSERALEKSARDPVDWTIYE